VKGLEPSTASLEG